MFTKTHAIFKQRLHMHGIFSPCENQTLGFAKSALYSWNNLQIKPMVIILRSLGQKQSGWGEQHTCVVLCSPQQHLGCLICPWGAIPGWHRNDWFGHPFPQKNTDCLESSSGVKFHAEEASENHFHWFWQALADASWGMPSVCAKTQCQPSCLAAECDRYRVGTFSPTAVCVFEQFDQELLIQVGQFVWPSDKTCCPCFSTEHTDFQIRQSDRHLIPTKCNKQEIKTCWYLSSVTF